LINQSLTQSCMLNGEEITESKINMTLKIYETFKIFFFQLFLDLTLRVIFFFGNGIYFRVWIQ
jgi:hypothetical protein